MFLTLDSKSTDNVRVSGTDEENNDVCSYLTINDMSGRSYAVVNYEDVEVREKSSSASLCSIKEEASNVCDAINVSEGDLSPCVKTEEKMKSDSQLSSDYEEMNVTTKT